MDAEAKFWARVNKTETCWLWTGYRMPNGYGMTHRHTLVHRYSWELAHGVIPDDREIDHLCNVRSCVRPDHMRLATHRENLYAPWSRSATAVRAGQTECKRGHPFNKENTRIRRNGTRKCRVCERQLATR